MVIRIIIRKVIIYGAALFSFGVGGRLISFGCQLEFGVSMDIYVDFSSKKQIDFLAFQLLDVVLLYRYSFF